jgi:hypothetical protein
MVAHSFFTVLRDGQAIHSETADVNLHSTSVNAEPSNINCTFYYTAPLVPTFWSNICQDHGELFLLDGASDFAGALVSEISLRLANHSPFYRSCPVFHYT